MIKLEEGSLHQNQQAHPVCDVYPMLWRNSFVTNCVCSMTSKDEYGIIFIFTVSHTQTGSTINLCCVSLQKMQKLQQKLGIERAFNYKTVAKITETQSLNGMLDLKTFGENFNVVLMFRKLKRNRVFHGRQRLCRRVNSFQRTRSWVRDYCMKQPRHNHHAWFVLVRGGRRWMCKKNAHGCHQWHWHPTRREWMSVHSECSTYNYLFCDD